MTKYVMDQKKLRSLAEGSESIIKKVGLYMNHYRKNNPKENNYLYVGDFKVVVELNSEISTNKVWCLIVPYYADMQTDICVLKNNDV